MLMKGVYVLIIKVEQPAEIQIKSLGVVDFVPGKWVYVGSAMGDGSTSLENRLGRHFRKQKTIYWHIDHLLDQDMEIVKAIWAQSTIHLECEVAHSLASNNSFEPGPKGFGASDCKKGCIAHIFMYNDSKMVDDILTSIFVTLGMQPQVTLDGVF